MKTVIDYLIYPYEREISKEQLKKVGTRLLISGFIALIIVSITGAIAKIMLTSVYAKNLVFWVINGILFQMTLWIIFIGNMMQMARQVPVKPSLKYKYQLSMMNAVIFVALGLQTYIICFSELPQLYIHIMVICTFLVMSALSFILFRISKKEKALGLKDRQINQSTAVELDFVVFFQGVKNRTRRKLLLALNLLLLLCLIPMSPLNFIYPIEINITYIGIPIAMSIALYMNLLQRKWQLVESSELENI